ncbi:MAG: Calx-beta domain-containing protein [Thiohalomonadales bacterium]
MLYNNKIRIFFLLLSSTFLLNACGGARSGVPGPNIEAGNLAFNSATSTIAEGGSSNKVIVTRTGGTKGIVSLSYTTIINTAVTPDDFTKVTDTLTFADGVDSQTITIPIINDTEVEGDEIFGVALSKVTGGATLGINSHTVIIVDDDVIQPGRLEFSTAKTRVTENGKNATLTVTRKGGISGTVKVNYNTVAGTATAGNDYTATKGTLTFAEGIISQTITIPIVDDTEVEDNETFTVDLSTPSGGASLGATTSNTVTIIENDVAQPGVLAFSVGTWSVNEGVGTTMLTVTRTGGSDGIVTVNYNTVDGIATASTPATISDYTSANETLTFAAGVTSQTVMLTIVDDTQVEGNETFKVNLSTPTGGASLGARTSNTVTIIDNDVLQPGTLAFSVATSVINENAGITILTVVRTEGSDNNVTVGYAAVAGGTATEGNDYTLAGNTLTFAAGVTSQTIRVAIVDDTQVEPDETFTLRLTALTGNATIGATSTATVTIIDNDSVQPQPGSLAFSVATSSINEGAGTATLTVTRTGGSDGSVTVNYGTVVSVPGAGIATEVDDYLATSGTLTFAAGVTSHTIPITIIDDILVEGDEIFTVDLSTPTGGASLGATSSTTVTIIDNDVVQPQPGTLAFSVATTSVNESAGTTTLTVTRTAGSGGIVSVNYATVAGTGTGFAAEISDYIVASGTLTFAAGEISKTITVTIVDDTQAEGDETFTVDLTVPTGNATIGVISTATVTIIDNDSVQQQLTVTTDGGSGTGNVTSVPNGINCGLTGTTCIAPFTATTNPVVVTLTATAAADSTFTGWSVGCTGVNPITTVTMDVAKTCTATFNLKTQPGNFTLSLSFGLKQLKFNWTPHPGPHAGAVTYNLLESNGTGSGFSPIASGLTGTSTVVDIEVHKLDWFNNKYLVEACVSGGTCYPSNEVVTMNEAVKAIGYVKASNTGTRDLFGISLALSGDGNTLAVGARGEDSSTTGINSTPNEGTGVNAGLNYDAGAVYVFTLLNSGWTQQAYIKASNTGAGDLFGISVSLSSNGNTLAVGSFSEDGGTTGINSIPDESALNSGAVYVFSRVNTTWSEQAYVKASNTGGGDRFGISVSLSSNGNTLAVGAKYEDSGTTGINSTPIRGTAGTGAVYVFRRVNTTWSQQAYIKASNTGVNDYFGESVALSGNGNSLAVGAAYEDSSTTGINSTPNEGTGVTSGVNYDAGAVYVFTQVNSTWAQQAYVKAGNTGTGDMFGISVALNNNGNTLVVGADGEASSSTGINSTPTESAVGAGAVYVFRRVNTTWAQQAYVKASNTSGGDRFGISVSLSSDGNTLAVGANKEASSTTGIDSAPDTISANAGAVYLFTRSNTTWTQKTYIKTIKRGSGDYFGTSVGLSNNGNTLAVGADGEYSSTTGINSTPNKTAPKAGAVYLY